MPVSVKIKTVYGETFNVEAGFMKEEFVNLPGGHHKKVYFPGYIIRTPLGERWLSCKECCAVEINGMTIKHPSIRGILHQKEKVDQ